jgi:beta-glucosidase
MNGIKSVLLSISVLCTISLTILSCTQNKTKLTPLMPTTQVHPEDWPIIKALPLDPAIEAQIDSILPKLTLEQKADQVIQGDTGSMTPNVVKKYRISLDVMEFSSFCFIQKGSDRALSLHF